MVDLAISVGQTQTPEAVLFWVLAPLTVAAALGMLLVKKAVHSAILMASVMVNLAVFYIAQDALFLGIVQIVVYTGAVMMLFLFILMLVGVDSSDSLTETIPGLRPIAIVAAVGFGGLMVSLIGRATLGRKSGEVTPVKHKLSEKHNKGNVIWFVQPNLVNNVIDQPSVSEEFGVGNIPPFS